MSSSPSLPPRWRRRLRRGPPRRVFVVVVVVGLLIPPVLFPFERHRESSFANAFAFPGLSPAHYQAFPVPVATDTVVASLVVPAPAAGRSRRSTLPRVMGRVAGVLRAVVDDAGMGGDDDDDEDEDDDPPLEELLGLTEDEECPSGPVPGDADTSDRGRGLGRGLGLPGGESSFGGGDRDDDKEEATSTGHAGLSDISNVSSTALSLAESSSSSRTRRRPVAYGDGDPRSGGGAAVPTVVPGVPPPADPTTCKYQHRHHPLLALLDQEGGDGNVKKHFHPGRGGYNATLLLECGFDLPEYVIRRDELEFDRMVDLLRKFRSRHGHCRVPTSYEGYRKMRTMEEEELSESSSNDHSSAAETDADDEDEEEDIKSLIRWVRLQRRLHRKLKSMLAEEDGRCDDQSESEGEGPEGGERHVVVVGAVEGWTMLTPDRANALTEIGFDFDPGRGPRHLAHVRLDELRRFHERHGHVDVPSRYPPNPRLASWVAEQRLQYRRLMDEERQQEEQRRTGTFGSKSVGSNDTERRRIYSSRTEPEFLEELRQLGFDFEPRPRTGRRTKGSGRRQSSSPAGGGSEYGFHGEVATVDGEVVEHGGDDDDDDEEEEEEEEDDWDKMVEELRRFRSMHGHCHVPQTHGRLGRWTYLQRRRYRHQLGDEGKTVGGEGDGEGGRAPLTSGLIERLRSMGFDFDVTEVEIARRTNDVAWVEMSDELAEFRRRYGHVNVPVDYGEDHDLGLWVVRQRRYGELRREGKESSPLTEERVEILEGLGVFDEEDHGGPQQQRLVERWDPRRGNVRIPPLTSGRDRDVT